MKFIDELNNTSFDDPFDEGLSIIKRTLRSEKGISKDKEEDSSKVRKWNIIPYGYPSECRSHLAVILDKPMYLDSSLKQALEQCKNTCIGITTYVLFYVSVSLEQWKEHWFNYNVDFNRLEDEGLEIRIDFDK